MEICKDCLSELTDENWYPSFRKINTRLCKRCNIRRTSIWRTNNRESERRHAVKSYWKHREKRLRARAEYSRTHKAQERSRDSANRKKLRQQVFEAYGNQCACCQEKRQEFFTIDHTNGDGKAHRKELGSRSKAHLYRYLRDRGFPQDRFRILCFNCNQSRGIHGYCPHEREHLRPSECPS